MSKNITAQEVKEYIRLNKALAAAGVGSRRAIDDLVAAGRISVNGQVAVQGQKINPALDKVSIDNVPVNMAEAGLKGYTYIMLHKPVQVVCTAHDPEGRETVLDILPETWRQSRIYPVGRLDYFSEGLLLLTDDGDLTFKLTHPSHHVPRVYEVKVRGQVAEAELAVMRRGMTLAEGEKLAPIAVERLAAKPKSKDLPSSGLPFSNEDLASPDTLDTLLHMTLHQGVNRQIRRMCRDLNLTILQLRRVQMGPLKLGDLPKGQARLLTEDELAALRGSLG